MLLSTLFSLPSDLSLVDIHLEHEGLTLVLKSSQTHATCPACTQPSTHIHGHYLRRLADLPCQKRPVRVCLEVRRFRCATRGCPRTTFAECYPTLTRPYARRTLRQAEALTEIAFALGGKAGAQLATRLAMPTSRQSLLRLIHCTPLPTHKTPRVLSLDDFAWKKGDRYGTLLVDVETHAPIDMLADREASSVKRWLHEHPGVKLISRDRAGAYAEGARRGAPRARQIADRYHLLVNLRNTLQAALARQQSSLPMLPGEKEPKTTEVSNEPITAEAERSPASGTAKLQPQTAAERRRQINRANRLARYERIVALAGQGLSERTIARHLHVSRQLVHRFVTAGSFPERAATSRRHSKLDPYLPYLRQRWEQGCHNGVQLAHEIQAQGFRGSTSLVGQYLSRWRGGLPEPRKQGRVKKRRPVPHVTRHLSARQASWLFITPKEHLTADQQALLERTCQTTAELQELYELGQDFVLMVKQRKPKQLDPWLRRAQKSASVELRGFASGIKRDHAAVKAALSFAWSQGQVEGQITRLKMLKRQMYGRARFELLRSRVLRRA